MASNHEVDGSATVPRVNRKDVAWLRREASYERGREKFYLEHPQHDTNAMAARNFGSRAAQLERIAAYLDARLPRRGERRT